MKPIFLQKIINEFLAENTIENKNSQWLFKYDNVKYKS